MAESSDEPPKPFSAEDHLAAETEEVNKTPMTKREALRFGWSRLASAGAVAAEFAAEQWADRFTPRVSRPPGALAEMDFLIECTRCGECKKACPVNAILELDHRAGLAQGTPFIDANRYRPCIACEDTPCISACPTEALQPIDIRDAVMGYARIDRATCIAWDNTTDKSCTRCHDQCPYPEDAILFDDEGRMYTDPRHCIGCGKCIAVCPTKPRSIKVEPPPRF